MPSCLPWHCPGRIEVTWTIWRILLMILQAGCLTSMRGMWGSVVRPSNGWRIHEAVQRGPLITKHQPHARLILHAPPACCCQIGKRYFAHKALGMR